eukprot:1782691-Pyramimonas_sp.AAC.1
MHASAAAIFSKLGENIEMAEWTAAPPLMRAGIKKIHESHSHGPYKESLVRHLQHGGASRRAVQAARLFMCTTCEEQARTAARPTAAQPKVKDFNEAISMDFMIMPDLDKNVHVVLVIVDVASDFTVAIYACPRSRPTAE